jgi:hypothetical protein
MKFICLGYYSEANWNAMSESEQNGFMEECLAYDDVLRANGHIIGGEALQPSDSAKTVRSQDGEVLITDGPYAETKEQIGGLLLVEARDLDHAVELMSRHPGVRVGPFEIRPADEACNALVAERAARVGSQKAGAAD